MALKFITVPFLCVLALLSTTAAAKVKLSLWHSSSENVALWQSIAVNFNTSQSEAELTITYFDTERMKQQVIKGGFNGRTADMIVMPSDWLGYQNVMQFSPIPTFLLDEGIDQTTIDESIFNGAIRGMPLSRGNHLLLMYNKRLVDKPATSWEMLIEQAPSFIDKKITPLALNYRETYWFMPFLSLFNTLPVVGDSVTLDNRETINALKFYKKLSDDHIVNAQCGYECVSTQFYGGNVAYSINGFWALHTATEKLGDDLGVALLPSLNGNTMKPMRANIVLSFPHNSLFTLKQDALMTFVSYLNDDRSQSLLYSQSGLFPVDNQLLNKMLNNSDDNVKAAYQQFRESHNLPATTAIPAVWNGFSKGMNMFLDNHLSAKQTVRYMQKSIVREQRLLNRNVH